MRLGCIAWNRRRFQTGGKRVLLISHCRVARISGVDVIPDTHARFEPGPASSIASKIHP
jgi:hypothetical protein